MNRRRDLAITLGMLLMLSLTGCSTYQKKACGPGGCSTPPPGAIAVPPGTYAPPAAPAAGVYGQPYTPPQLPTGPATGPSSSLGTTPDQPSLVRR